MKTQNVIKFNESMPTLFEELFKPWGGLFDGRSFKREMNVPAVNIAEHKIITCFPYLRLAWTRQTSRSMWTMMYSP